MLQMLYDKWWKEYGGAGKCDTGDDKVRKDANALTIANVGGVFVVLIVGLLLSPVVAAFEFVWNARKRRRKRAHSQSHDRAVFAIYLVSLDQELISYHYSSSASSCSSCWSYLFNPRLRRFKSDRDEIWPDCSSSKYPSTESDL